MFQTSSSAIVSVTLTFLRYNRIYIYIYNYQYNDSSLLDVRYK